MLANRLAMILGNSYFFYQEKDNTFNLEPKDNTNGRVRRYQDILCYNLLEIEGERFLIFIMLENEKEHLVMLHINDNRVEEIFDIWGNNSELYYDVIFEVNSQCYTTKKGCIVQVCMEDFSDWKIHRKRRFIVGKYIFNEQRGDDSNIIFLDTPKARKNVEKSNIRVIAIKTIHEKNEHYYVVRDRCYRLDS